VREGAHVPVQETDLVLTMVDPGEVAARVHQPAEKHPRLAAGAGFINEDFEEVDLGQLTGAVHQGDIDLPALPLPLGHGFLDEGHPDFLSLVDQQRVQTGGRQLLLLVRPFRRVRRPRLDLGAEARWLSGTGLSRAARVSSGLQDGHAYRTFDRLRASLARELKVRSAILDGEIVCLDDEGRSHFNPLLFRRCNPVFAVFDLISLRGRDLRQLPLMQRKATLRELVPDTSATYVPRV